MEYPWKIDYIIFLLGYRPLQTLISIPKQDK